MRIDRRIFNIVIIVILSIVSFSWTFWIFHLPIMWDVVLGVTLFRILASLFLFRDYSLSWSKATTKTFLIKTTVYTVAFFVYLPIYYGKVRISFLLSELAFFILAINFLMYAYLYFRNKSLRRKSTRKKRVVIYGAGKAGMRVGEELQDENYDVCCFIDDEEKLQGRSVDGVEIISKEDFLQRHFDKQIDMLVLAMPSASQSYIRRLYDELSEKVSNIRILPPLENMLLDRPYVKQLKEITIEDLLARRPKDLDKTVIQRFIQGKRILITGAGGSIGSEIVRQCLAFGAASLVLVDNGEYNLYAIGEEVPDAALHLMSVTDRQAIFTLMEKVKPDVVIHAAAYKHVPLCEANPDAAVLNNVAGTQNVVDAAIACGVSRLVIVSTDKAVRPTNVMGATKRVTELYAQNVDAKQTEIVSVRFGNVLGSSGSVIPKFKAQIEKGGPVTVTHPEMTRYFMLIPEACQLVLQAAAIAKGGELFILDMGEPVKIVDLAKQMIRLYGKEGEVEIVYTGLRPGEKLYEELLLDEREEKTRYRSIFVARPTIYDIRRLREDIEELLASNDKKKILKRIVPEYTPEENS